MPKDRYESSLSYELFSSTLIARMRRVRQNAGLSQKELAKRCGLSISTIRKLETGLQKVSAFVIYLYCNACNVEATDLLPSTSSAQTESAKVIDSIISDLQLLDMHSLQLIKLITQYLAKD